MYKSKLQDICHQYAWSLPEYVTTKDGPDHNSRFSTSITVNGVLFRTPPNQFRSSEESQNEAAKIAFEYFTVPKPILQQSIKPTLVHPKLPINSSPSEMLHLYKNSLQSYAQKRNLTQPIYSCEIMGPPHARRFKSKVTVDGKSYETSNFFNNLKDAEHAAAKVAFESMSLPETQEDEGLYKGLLQELAQKGGFRIPTYETDKSGPPHTPTFVSKVEIGGESFEGHKAKSKKLAEMNAAKAAYNSLIERRGRLYSTVSAPGFQNKGALEFSSFNLQPNVIEKVEPNVVLKINSSIEEQAREIRKKDINGEKHRKLSSSENEYARLQGPTSTFSPPKDGSSLSSPSIARSDIEISAGAQTSATERILVCACSPDLTIPDGVTILPISDNEWVAMRLEENHSH